MKTNRRKHQGKSQTASRLVSANELPREALVEIVAVAQSQLYLDMDEDGREFWNPGKGCSGWDVCQAIQEAMSRHGLVPGEEQDCVQPAEASSAVSAGELVAWAQSQGLAPEDLDDHVHDQASTLASSLNNRGLSAQIGFLVEQLGSAETRKLLAEVAADKARTSTTHG
jgi:hypothetical protein